MAARAGAGWGASWTFVLTASVVAVLAGAIGVAFPLLYETRETSGAGAAVAWALLGFVLAPLVGAALGRAAGVRLPLAGGAAALAMARLALQWVHPIPLWLAVLGVGAGLIALGATLDLTRGREGGSVAAAAFVTGLAVDAGIRAAYQTWDPAWRSETGAAIVAVALVAAMLAALSFVPRDAAPTGDGSLRAGAVVGPALLVQTLFAQNLAFQASEAGYAVPWAFVTTFVADLLALAYLGVVARRNDPAWLAWATASGVLAGTALLGLTSVVVPAVALTQVATADLLARAFGARGRRDDAWRTHAGVALGMLAFVTCAFAYQIDVIAPLPVPRATWPIAAATLLAILGLRRRDEEPSRVPLAPFAVPVVACAIALATWPVHGSRPEPALPGDRLLQWNVHTAIDAHGQLDLEGAARTIESDGANVVVLEEVGRGWPIAGQVDELSWLARRLGMHVAWAPGADDQFGNAILSAFPLSDTEVLRLPYGSGPQHRSAVRARLPDGLWVLGAHLEGHTVATRTEQVETILGAWGADRPLALAGDLNMQPGQPDEQLYVHAGLQSVQDTIGDPTASTSADPSFPGDRVDWIWTSVDLSISGFAILRSPVSDHLPIVVDVTPTSSR
ncbi:MAG: endonuclease/exonuclease/phosphatase family protein [Planctomycetaceae bacterium]